MRYGCMLGMVMVAMKVNAGYVVDLYGDPTKRGQSCLKKYSQAVMHLEKENMHLYEHYYGNIPDALGKKIHQNRANLFKKIKSVCGYLYVNDGMVMYPGNPTRYITLEVIRPQDKDRMRWVQPPPTCLNCSPKQDVIQTMIEYESLGETLFIKNQIDFSHLDCTGYHCTFGFKHPLLKPFRRRFDEGVRHQKSVIIAGLHEKDSMRRAAAAFMVGEFDNPHEIINVLLPHVNDPDGHVRNNVIRVIGDTMIHAKDYQIDVRPFIQLLRSPYETDRNKSLLVLLEAAHLIKQKEIIKKEGLVSLRHLAQLKQPNNHDFAQIILNQIG